MGLNMNNRTKRCITDLILFVALIVIDRVSKVWAVKRLKGGDSIPIIRDVIEFHYLPNGNTGAAFGILAGHRILFLVIAAVVVAIIAYLVINIPQDKKFKMIEILLVFIAAGGAGNMIDRFIQDYVIDFIYISCINFPIFNVADMYVSVCTVILAVIILFRLKEEDYITLEDSFLAPFKNRSDKTPKT